MYIVQVEKSQLGSWTGENNPKGILDHKKNVNNIMELPKQNKKQKKIEKERHFRLF